MPDWKGLRILNTRPLGQNEALSKAIRDAGGIPVECPALAIEPIDNDWWRALGDLASIDWAIFISTNAVQFCFERIKVWPESIRVVAVGQATAHALKQWGVRVDEVPLLASSEGLLNLEAMQHVHDKTILLVKGENGRALLADTLTQRGALVHPLVVYRRVLPVVSPAYIESLWHEDAVDAIVFTSEEAMHHLFQLFGQKAHDWLRSKPCSVQSQRLAKAAADLGVITISVDDHFFMMPQKG
jgi:uroporphyrinogen-III synthase